EYQHLIGRSRVPHGAQRNRQRDGRVHDGKTRSNVIAGVGWGPTLSSGLTVRPRHGAQQLRFRLKFERPLVNLVGISIERLLIFVSSSEPNMTCAKYRTAISIQRRSGFIVL